MLCCSGASGEIKLLLWLLTDSDDLVIGNEVLIHPSTFRVEYCSLVGRQDLEHCVWFPVIDHSGSREKIAVEQTQTLRLRLLFSQSNCFLLPVFRGGVG